MRVPGLSKRKLKRFFLTTLKQVARLGSDVLWAAAAFILCAALLLFVLKQLFPEGNTNTLLFQAGIQMTSASLKKSSRFQTDIGKHSSDTAQASNTGATATLSRVESEVKNKRATGIVWEKATTGLKLYDRDAIQTQEKAKATIVFDKETFIEMDENSLVIIRHIGQSRILKTRRSFMLVANGKLRGHVDNSVSGNINFQIALPSGLAEIDTKNSQGNKTEFEINVLPDESTTITVFKGLAKVSANGEMVSVAANESTQIDALHPPAKPIALLEAVALKQPLNQKIVYYRHVPQDLEFKWTPHKKAMRYQLHISDEPSFKNLVLNETVSHTAFVHGNLKKGVYFWRVAAIDALGVKGTWSPLSKIEVVQLLEPPALQVLFPKKDDVINQKSITIHGISDPSATLYINGKALVPKKKGQFQHKVQLKKGINLIVIESVDRVGNMSFERRLISRKY